MKLLSLILIIQLISNFSFSQNNFGVTGGLNFDSPGKAQFTFETKDLERESGFNIGVYSEFDFLIGYVHTELQFTNLKIQLDGDRVLTNRIDLPISFGLKLFGPFSFLHGPTVYYSLYQKSSNYSFMGIKNKTTLGLHLGTRMKLGTLGIDLRYERGLSPIQANVLSKNSISIIGKIESRPNQLMIGVSYK